LRVYCCLPARKPARLLRFESEVLRLWTKYGIRQAGSWTTLIGKSSQEITYLRACPVRPSRRRTLLAKSAH
jgi:hypothetical protein